MTATFTCLDMEALTDAVADAWRSGSDRDWSAPAGGLDWTCSFTADHAVDTVSAPAFFLASRRRDDYPEGGWSPGAGGSPDKLIEGLQIASRLLVGVVQTTPGDVRAIIWRRPQVELRGPEDFAARGGLELALHAHDVCSGLGVAFRPPTQVAEHLRQQTRDWPFWSGYWAPLAMSGDPWEDLLRASGRL